MKLIKMKIFLYVLLPVPRHKYIYGSCSTLMRTVIGIINRLFGYKTITGIHTRAKSQSSHHFPTLNWLVFKIYLRI